ncbi:MAG: hypothetical protein M1823_000107 [Watsoniomyces obsoletus]|nr:MAG: hypothetical protein M1823_000107 [Watsoniomyces obsoletus]
MSAKTLSPGAHLLRHSRLFSLPAPLPKPETLHTASGTFQSDTATLPYPTLAAITTPSSSLARGDWGLKRTLPLRSTTGTSTPVIRVGAIDNIAHITDFASAADHVITLKKWQELGLPMSRVESITRRTIGDTAKQSHEPFDWNHDRTSVAGGGRGGGAAQEPGQRWRFGGPWLVGQTQREFRQYLRKVIAGREQEFREYLRHIYEQKKVGETRLRGLANVSSDELATESAPASNVAGAPTEPVTLSEEELDGEIRNLRRQWPPEQLHNHLQAFLDLPITEGAPRGRSVQADLGPPRTHPSAGLSYLRTPSTLINDPRSGPQANVPLVEARVLAPKRNAQNLVQRPMLGVGGIVTGRARNYAASVQEASSQQGRDAGYSSPLIDMDTTTPGGGKCLVEPIRASVDSQGRICLTVEVPYSKNSVTKPTSPPPMIRRPSSSSGSSSLRRGSSFQSSAAPTTTSRTGSGYGTANFPRTSPGSSGTSAARGPFHARPTSPAGGMADVLGAA